MDSAPIKPWEELTIQDDYIFKRVMHHKRICKKLLEKILRIRSAPSVIWRTRSR